MDCTVSCISAAEGSHDYGVDLNISIFIIMLPLLHVGRVSIFTICQYRRQQQEPWKFLCSFGHSILLVHGKWTTINLTKYRLSSPFAWSENVLLSMYVHDLAKCILSNYLTSLNPFCQIPAVLCICTILWNVFCAPNLHNLSESWMSVKDLHSCIAEFCKSNLLLSLCLQ